MKQARNHDHPTHWAAEIGVDEGGKAVKSE